jgi:hypothetical protein
MYWHTNFFRICGYSAHLTGYEYPPFKKFLIQKN